MTLFSFPWPEQNALKTFAAVAHKPYALFFDSARPGHPLNRYSYICWDPVETIEVNKTFQGNPFDVLQDRLALWNAEHDPSLPPFQGGAAGFFGYDLGRHLEELPQAAQDNPGMPDMAIGLYDQVIAFDHNTGKAWLIIHAESKKEALTNQKAANTLFRHPGQAQRDPGSIHTGTTPWIPAFAGMTNLDWTPDCDDETYIRKIKTIIEAIYAGEVYQVNLSRRFTADLPESFDPFAQYCHLRDVNAAPFAAYLNFGDLKIASTSPERFLQVQDGQVETRPIKGTLASSNAAEDLSTSDKDRAENTMIVDLLRNDISKVCQNHSVKVPQLCGVESFEGLHHLVSIVTGTLQKNKTPIDLLKACFPGGSITGAPKIRAMEIIESLEPNRRGPYCGAIGMIGFDGMMDSSITIRTLVYQGNQVTLQTGGGIVADSKPAAELQETLDKADKIFESFKLSYQSLKKAS